MVPTRLELWRQPVTFINVMVTKTINLKHHLTAIGCALLLGCMAGGMARADAKTDALLDTLATAPPKEAERAARDLERAWASSGSAAMDLLLKRGRDALKAGKPKVAIGHLTALTDHAPQFAEGYNARATAYFRAELYGPALDDLERALALNPKNYNAIFGLGVMFNELGYKRRAAELFREVLVLNPHHETAPEMLKALERDGIGRTL